MEDLNERIIETLDKKRNWFYIISPCVLGIIISLFVIIMSKFYMKSSGGWSFLGVIIFVPVMIVLFGIDVLIKFIFKKNILAIWILELLLMLLICIFYLDDYGLFN